jgi:hypothetical protein
VVLPFTWLSDSVTYTTLDVAMCYWDSGSVSVLLERRWSLIARHGNRADLRPGANAGSHCFSMLLMFTVPSCLTFPTGCLPSIKSCITFWSSYVPCVLLCLNNCVPRNPLEASSGSASQEIPRFFYGIRIFITLFKFSSHWSLSWARCIQSTISHPVYLDSF